MPELTPQQRKLVNRAIFEKLVAPPTPQQQAKADALSKELDQLWLASIKRWRRETGAGPNEFPSLCPPIELGNDELFGE